MKLFELKKKVKSEKKNKKFVNNFINF